MKLKLIKGVFLLFFALLSYISKTKAAETPEANNAQISSNDTTAKFNFETGTQEWKSQNWQDFRGSNGVEQTSKYSKSGKYSLLLDCDTKNKGEAFVDLRTDFNAPLNLEGKTIKCWVLIPSSKAGGNPNNSNGVQLFVKSIKNGGTSNEQWFTEYGTRYDLSGRTGSWFEITLKPSIKTPKGGYSDQGFDPKNIVIIGIKIGTVSSSSFKGPLFIDDIDW